MRLFTITLCLLLANVTTNPVDTNASPETVQLYNTLLSYTQKSNKTLFGHHDATLFGAGGGRSPYILGEPHNGFRGWLFSVQQAQNENPDELCDIKDVTGEYPAVIGFDLGGNVDDADERLRNAWLIKKAADRKLIITLSWHQNNPISGGRPWIDQDHTGVNITHPIRRILPNGDYNHLYRQRLDSIADWMKQLRDSSGHLVPAIFRPYHEMTGGWFWWGTNQKTDNTPDDFKELYQYTVRYLRDTKGVHNLLYAYSPDKVKSASDFLQFYPGDEYVDLMGLDFYYIAAFNPSVQTFQQMVQILTDTAHAHGKIAAITEVGIFNNGLDTHHNFWNDHVLDALKSGQGTTRLAYVLGWGNICLHKCEIWVPYKGHPAESAFLVFFNDAMTVFEKSLASSVAQIVVG
ncbi:hypothetical protein ACJMK2_042525 [Sinanodonta woodiana]|uniref:GH26 domain-containing protein n=1 Tax=Sinanodonta woodiana TaxID=1069815 RepID=A0ABD3W7L9_SINWO